MPGLDRLMTPPTPGLRGWEFAAGEVVRESRRFLWLPRYLPVVDRKGRWDGRTYRFLWLVPATLRGTRFGWEVVVQAAHA